MKGIRVAADQPVSGLKPKEMLFTTDAIATKNSLYFQGNVTPQNYTNPNNGDTMLAAQVDINHNLGYVPVMFVWFRPANYNGNRGIGNQAPHINDTNNPKGWSFIDNFVCVAIPGKNVSTLQFRYGQAGKDFEYRVYILVERSNG